jgi:DNA (cytosine-5)-methyltransferase 1
MERVTFGSLFSGVGGIDFGLARAGLECRWQAETDGFAAAILAKHWPDVRRYSDVKEIRPEELEPVDLVCGGPPCGPHSTAAATRRRGIDDERWLWPEFARIIRGLRPRWVFIENVPGILSVNGGEAFGEILLDLALGGYAVEWTTLPASAVGAPHLRRRVFIVAHLPDSAGRRWRLGTCRGRGKPEETEGTRIFGLISSEERRAMAAGNGGKLNPTWVSWLMGFPLDWLHDCPEETLGELYFYLGLPPEYHTAMRNSRRSGARSSRKLPR